MRCDFPAGLDFSKLQVLSTNIDDEFLRDSSEDAVPFPQLTVVKKDARHVRQAEPNAETIDAEGRVLMVPAENSVAPGFVGHRPSFNINPQSDPQVFNTLRLVSTLQAVDASFGVHKIAVLNPPKTIQELEAALQVAWLNSNSGTIIGDLWC